MEASPPDSPRMELLNSSQPSSTPALKHILPLRIVKQSDNSCGGPDIDLDDYAPRKCSQETDESRGSAPDPPGGERQLTVPKIRRNRNSQLFGSLDEVDESHVPPFGRRAYLPKVPRYTGHNSHTVPATNNMPLSPRYNLDNRDECDMDSVQSRHIPRLRGKACTKSDIGFRDQFAFLTSKRSVPTAYRPFPGLIDIIQRSTTANSFENTVPSPMVMCNEYEHVDDPFTSPLPRHGSDYTPSALLVPLVCVTPDTRVIDTGCHNVWVAVEIMADLCRPENEHRGSSEGIIPRSQKSSRSAELDARTHGYLYDLKVEVESASNSRVLEVVEHEASPSTFMAGSKTLVLVNIELDLTNFSRLRGHIRSQSDELMEDLEDQLGSAQCDYLKVNLAYRHSAFSYAAAVTGSVSSSSGITKSITEMRTTFTAAINRHNAVSPWSPPPAPTPNRLVGIIAAHWGMDAADNLLHNKLMPQKITPRKTTYLSCPSTSRGRARDFGERASGPLPMVSPTRLAPQPPTAAHPHRQQRVRDENRRNVHDENSDDETFSDSASKIWAKIRRCSGISMSHHRRDTSTSTIASVAASVNLPFSATCGTDGRALRRKKGDVTEGSLVIQRRRLAAMASQQNLTDRTNLSTADAVGALDASKRRSPKGSGKGRRGSGRWGFGNWWLNG